MTSESYEADAPESPMKSRLIVALALTFIAMLVYGTLLGNVFETYKNASTL